MNTRRIIYGMASAVLSAALLLSGCSSAPAKNLVQAGGAQSPVDYSKAENWAYRGSGTDKEADLFLICPSVCRGSDAELNMSLADGNARKSFIGALNMERGIYDGDCRMYAPFYRQATLYAYTAGGAVLDDAIREAYADVRRSFRWYMVHQNNGRPVVLAGFSQGAQLLIMLMKDEFKTAERRNQLVAAYAIGWRLTEDETSAYPQLKPASSETDTGVIISFNSEAESVRSSMLVPEGVRTYSINPLNWKTDGTAASKELNEGACFTDYSGAVKKEIPSLCGAYIDQTRGTLKVTDITPEEYPPVLPMFAPGVYHLYDYQFFYRNLQENVHKRVRTWLKRQ